MLFYISTFICSLFLPGRFGRAISFIGLTTLLMSQAWNIDLITSGDIPVLSPFLSSILQIFIVRGSTPYVLRILSYFERKLQPKVAAKRLKWLLRGTAFGMFISLAFLYISCHWLFFQFLYLLPLSWSLAFLLVFGPLVVIMNLSIVLNIIFAFVSFIFGFDLVGSSGVFILTSLKFFSEIMPRVASSLSYLPWFLEFLILNFLRVFKFMMYWALRFWAAVYHDTSFVFYTKDKGDYFIYRVALAWIVFIMSLLGFELVLLFWHISILLSLIVSILIAYVSGFGFYTKPLFFCMYFILRSAGLLGDHPFLPSANRIKRMYFLYLIKLLNIIGIKQLTIVTSIGPLNITEVNIPGRTDRQIELLWESHHFRLPGFFWFFAALFMFCFVLERLITGFFTKLVKPVFLFPIRVLIALRNAFLVFLIPSSVLEVSFSIFSFPVFILWNSGLLKEAHRYLRMLGLSLLYGYSYLSGPVSVKVLKGDPDRENLSRVFVRSWVSLTRRSILKFMERLDSIRLPELIQSAYNPPSLDSIRSTYSLLGDMGFAVDQSFLDSLTRPESSPYLAEWGSWKKWLIGTSNFALGFRKLSVSVHSWLPADFYPEVPGYIHSGTFTGVAEEIISNARYYSGSDLLEVPDEFDKLYDDLWHSVKIQFENSQLSSFDEIYRKWTKRFNMGFGFGKHTKSGKLVQLTRQAVIESMGGKKPFMKAWEKVFYNAQKLLLPSPVFTKWETLKLKKALSRSVRTVVGSSFVHHVMTTVFNYKPNHNYHPWETPMKVGMPLNGQNFNRVWESLTGYEKVWAGDMTAFDSSQSPFMLKLVAEIRKKGYELHRDYDAICQLIDISYDMLINQPMGFKNFGDISFKAQGATTGHSSTTPDNSMMLVANYLFAWRFVTGLRAREFFNFNSLSNFGDDHVLGYDPVFGWSPHAAIQAMKKLGTIMRDEAPGQDQLPYPGMVVNGETDPRNFPFSFLSKKPVPVTGAIASELQRAGVSVPLTFATIHDRSRLLGKIKGMNLASKSKRTLSSYDALISYLYLTAHSKDIYDKLIGAAIGFHRQNYHLWLKDGVKPNQIKAPPSYGRVLREWYSAEPFPFKEGGEISEDDENLELVIHSSPDPFGLFVRWISDFPTLLSPRYTNTRWADWIQRKLGNYLSWPLTFLAMANQTQNDAYTSKLLLARSPYSFLRNDTIRIIPISFGTLLLRHWIYMGFTRLYQRRKFFTIFDLFRLLDSAYINAVFILTGRLSQIVVELDLHVLETVLIYLLNFVHFDVYVPPVPVDLLSPSVLVARLTSYFLRLVTPAGAIDFQPFDAAVGRLAGNIEASFALQAPTGVGKSTRMMARLVTLVRRRVIVITPRHLVAVGVGKYMQGLYPDMGVGISTEGHTFKPTDVLIYCTAQAFLLNHRLREPGSVIVLDEAHIQEAHYNMVKQYFKSVPMRRIFVTATPLPFDLPLIVLPSNNQNEIVETVKTVETLNDYLKYASLFANDRVSLEKVLIFVPTKEMMSRLSSMINHKICLLSSEDRYIDETATVYISTSVSDAGITIPDVQFVLSPDVDIFLEYKTNQPTGFVQEWKNVRAIHDNVDQVVPRYFRIPDYTIQQRRGRTGRTMAGTFILFEIKEIEVVERKLNVMDYIVEAQKDFENLGKYIPKELFVNLNPDYLPLIFEMLPGATYETLVTLTSHVDDDPFGAPANTLTDKLAKLANHIKERFTRYSSLNPEKYDPEHPPEELVVGHKVRGEPTIVLPPTLPHQVVKPDPPKVAPMTVRKKAKRVATLVSHSVLREHPPYREIFFGRKRISPSGEGLLCGARALIGLYYNIYQIVLPEDRMVNLIKSFYPPGFQEDYERFFSADQLFAAGAVLGIEVQIFLSKNEMINFPIPDADLLPFMGELHLLNGHYYYMGFPLPEYVPIADGILDQVFSGQLWKSDPKFVPVEEEE